MEAIAYHRKPTQSKIKFGEGAIHYIDLQEDFCKKKNGHYKKWLIYNGERYYY